MKTRYKFLKEGFKSAYGDCEWKIGEWKHEDNPELCGSGFHCSKKVYEAFNYVQGEILAKVEVKGTCDKVNDKECYSDMRIVKAYKWTKKDSVELAIYAAELVIGIYEKEYPNDDRPRKAIEAAKKYVKNPTAAEAAGAAWAAEAAAGAAEAAAAAAEAAWAAWAAEEAAGAAGAAWAAEAAAGAAEAAARAAAAAREARVTWVIWVTRATMIKKIDVWMTERINQLEEIL